MSIVWSPTTYVRPRPSHRRRGVALVAAGVALLAALAVAFHGVPTAGPPHISVAAQRFAFPGRAAYALGDGPVRLSDRADGTAPIASMAKVMTALVILRHHPLADGEDGPSFTVTAADVADTDRRRDRDESLVPVEAGEELTERQALLAILLPSANNVAIMATRLASPSVPAFVAAMNDTARKLGMTDTHYTDPSGFDASTVSTAADQVVLARAAGANRTLATLAATRRAHLPVAGGVTNTDTLLGDGVFLGLKTGSHDAAGGCFLFHARRVVDGRSVDVWGVVMGQRGHDLIGAALAAAQRLVAGLSAR